MGRLIFVKPTVQDFCGIIVFEKEGNIYLHDAFSSDSISGLNSIIVSKCNGQIEQIRYDITVYIQDAKDLRKLLPDIDIFCYKPKQKLEERVSSSSEWLKNHLIIRLNATNPDYLKFVELMKSYKLGDKERTIALNVLSDVARYYRKSIL